jgi:hypothetical protein
MMADPTLFRMATWAERRLHAELEDLAPFMAEQVSAWIEELFGGASLGEAFTRPSAFPILPLPRWVEESFDAPDERRQAELAYSSMGGYLYIRLIDNLMDADAPGDPRLLPALNFLSTVFTRPYQEWFARSDPFWDHFERIWIGTAEVTMQDARLAEVDLDLFRTVSARKTGAAKIPVTAICHLHDRLEHLPRWEEFVDAFGVWHQFQNDLQSWQRDLAAGATTYLLSEARRRRVPGEPVAGWLIREGLGWAMDILQDWMTDLMELSGPLGSPGLGAYLTLRQEMLAVQTKAVRSGAEAVRRLTAELERVTPTPGPESDDDSCRMQVHRSGR